MPYCPTTTMATTKTSAKSATATSTVEVTPSAATMPVETSAPANEYTNEKIGRKTIKGNVGNMDNATVKANKDGEEFLAFDFCVNGKDENGADTKTWYTVRTDKTKLKAVIETGDQLELEGNHFVKTRVSDGKTYNILNAYKVAFC